MFLKNSLEEKLKRSLSEYHSNPEQPKNSPSQNISKTQRFRLFNSKESKQDYLNFPRDHKKFNDDDVPKQAKEAKEYLQALIDPDILELRKKRWNISSQPNQNERPELKRTLFEVSHGLRDFQVVELKEQKVELGTDTRNYCYEGWNGSTLLENIEKKEIVNSNLENAKINSLKYWKKNQKKRIGDNFVDLVEENSKSPKNKVFVKYKNPVSSAIEYNKLLKNIKSQTSEVREKWRKQVAYDNPASTTEKLEALVFKEMFNTYRNELKYRTGKVKQDKNIVVNEEPKINESTLIANVAAYLEEQMKNNNYNKTQSGNNNNNNFSGTNVANSEKLSFIYKDTETFKKDNVQATIPPNNFTSSINYNNTNKKTVKKEDNFVYPLDYDTYKKTLEFKRKEDTINGGGNNSENDTNMNKTQGVYGVYGNYANEERKNNFNYMNNNNLPTINNKNDYFFSNHKGKSSTNTNKWVKYEYTHSGTYTEFVFKEKKVSSGNPNSSFEYKEKKKFSWSCCMNDKRDSIGCKKTVINRLKWNLDSIP